MRLINVSKTINANTNKTQISICYRDADGETQQANVLESHANFQEIDNATKALRAASRSGESQEFMDKLGDDIISLANASHNVVSQIASKFEKLDVLDGRLIRKGNRILVDYEPIDSSLEKLILKILSGENTDIAWSALSAFIENLYSNELSYVREQLFSWLRATNSGTTDGFTITDDGCLIGYKGCDSDVDGHPRSRKFGFAIVNGEEQQGYIDNSIGNVVEMPRQMVQNDPSQGCSTGLHIGTWDYASGWSNGFILKVKFNPRDVVSIPNDCSYQKLRACRYEVLEVVSTPTFSAVDYNDKYGDDYDDDYDEDEDYED